MSYSSSIRLCANFVCWVGVGAKESPLLSSLSSSMESVRLLRLCTVKVIGVVYTGPLNKIEIYIRVPDMCSSARVHC